MIATKAKEDVLSAMMDGTATPIHGGQALLWREEMQQLPVFSNSCTHSQPVRSSFPLPPSSYRLHFGSILFDICVNLSILAAFALIFI